MGGGSNFLGVLGNTSSLLSRETRKMEDGPSPAMKHWTFVMSKLKAYIESQGGKVLALVFDTPEKWFEFLKLNAQKPTTNTEVVAFTEKFTLSFTDPNDRDFGSSYEAVAYPCLDIVVYCLNRGLRMTGTGSEKMAKILQSK